MYNIIIQINWFLDCIKQGLRLPNYWGYLVSQSQVTLSKLRFHFIKLSRIFINFPDTNSGVYQFQIPIVLVTGDSRVTVWRALVLIK